MTVAGLLLALFVPATRVGAAPQVTLEPAVVRLEQVDGAERWTVRATECSAALLVRRLAELSERQIDATPALENAPLITVALERRPIAEVLEYTLGAAGLRGELNAETIVVRQDRRDRGTLEERLGLASAAWARASERFPDHPTTAGARLAQGELEELLGRGESARARYLDVVTNAPESPSAPEAYLRAGRVAVQRGDWSEASEHFRALANLPGATEYIPVARLELARATLRLGDPASALQILAALDELSPPWDSLEAAARALVRMEALLEAGRFQDVLTELDTDVQRFDAVGQRSIARIRAQALEGAGLSDEASRAWLVAARGQNGPERLLAYRTAARLCAQSEDWLGVLFVAREARSSGFGGAVAADELAARRALGLVLEEPDPAPGVEDRIQTAELWLAHDLVERAGFEFEGLYRDRVILGLGGERLARVVLGHARCLRDAGQLDVAIELVRSERSASAAIEFRRALDAGMASFFEEAGLFERAADAWGGSY